MPSSTLSRGNILNEVLLSVTLTPTSVAANTTATQTFALPGILTTDYLSAIAPLTSAQIANILVVGAFVSAANVVAIQFMNTSAAAVTPVSGGYGINVIRPENVPVPGNML
jgi:hypothetical protein